MKRLGYMSLGLFAVLIAISVSAASAVAVQPVNLPETSKKYTGAGEGITTYDSAQGKIECETSKSEGTEEQTGNGPPSGPFHIDFGKCKNTGTGITCTGLGEATGVILALGTVKLVFDKEVGKEFKELTVATLFETSPVHFSCSALVLIETKGEVVCLDLKPTESNKVHSFHCVGSEPEKGVFRSTEEYCKGGDTSGTCVEPTRPILLESVNHGAFTEALELALGNTNFTTEAISGMI